MDTSAHRLFEIPGPDGTFRDYTYEPGDYPPADTLLDVLVNLLQKASNELRNLANLVFGMMASSFTSEGIQSLVKVTPLSFVTCMANALKSVAAGRTSS